MSILTRLFERIIPKKGLFFEIDGLKSEKIVSNQMTVDLAISLFSSAEKTFIEHKVELYSGEFKNFEKDLHKNISDILGDKFFPELTYFTTDYEAYFRIEDRVRINPDERAAYFFAVILFWVFTNQRVTTFSEGEKEEIDFLRETYNSSYERESFLLAKEKKPSIWKLLNENSQVSNYFKNQIARINKLSTDSESLTESRQQRDLLCDNARFFVYKKAFDFFLSRCKNPVLPEFHRMIFWLVRIIIFKVSYVSIFPSEANYVAKPKERVSFDLDEENYFSIGGSYAGLKHLIDQRIAEDYCNSKTVKDIFYIFCADGVSGNSKVIVEKGTSTSAEGAFFIDKAITRLLSEFSEKYDTITKEVIEKFFNSTNFVPCFVRLWENEINSVYGEEIENRVYEFKNFTSTLQLLIRIKEWVVVIKIGDGGFIISGEDGERHIHDNFDGGIVTGSIESGGREENYGAWTIEIILAKKVNYVLLFSDGADNLMYGHFFDGVIVRPLPETDPYYKKIISMLAEESSPRDKKNKLENILRVASINLPFLISSKEKDDISIAFAMFK